MCGAAASTAATQLVDDVEAFPGHIACDGASMSEIVVPSKFFSPFAYFLGANCVWKFKMGRDRRWLIFLLLVVVVNREVKAIIDVDCAVKSGFNEVDRLWLEKLAVVLGKACEW